MTEIENRLETFAPRHRLAIESALSFITTRFEASGVLVAGTIIRGEGHANSDLDFAVVHEHPWRQRVQRIVHGVPVEIFINPVSGFERSFQREIVSGAPAMLGILSSGIPLQDDQGLLGPLIAEAKRLFASGPSISDQALTALRYNTVSKFEDAVDLAIDDPDRSHAFVVEALLLAARLRFLQDGRWQPREKDLFTHLAAIDPPLGEALRQVFDAPRLGWIELATPIIRQIAGSDRFFEWESAPEQA